MRTLKVSGLLAMSLATITAFQNCSSGNGMTFANQTSSSSLLAQSVSPDAGSGSVSGSGTSTGSGSGPVTATPQIPGHPLLPPSLSPPTSGAPNVCDAPFVAVSGACVCPGNENFNGSTCVACGANQVFNSTTKSCLTQCSPGSNISGNSCVTCESNQAWDGKECVTPSATCKSFQEVKSPFVIPARDSAQTCYYVRMSHSYANETSSNWTAREPAVQTRDHDDYSDSSPVHPYIIGSSATDPGAVGTALFSLLGTREIILAGDDYGSKDISVDNLMFVTASVNGAVSAFGEGTADAPTYNNPAIAGDIGAITFNGAKVMNYYVGAAGGTATFVPVNLADPSQAFHLPLNTQISLKTEALDCGGVGGASDVYLMFR